MRSLLCIVLACLLAGAVATNQLHPAQAPQHQAQAQQQQQQQQQQQLQQPLPQHAVGGAGAAVPPSAPLNMGDGIAQVAHNVQTGAGSVGPSGGDGGQYQQQLGGAPVNAAGGSSPLPPVDAGQQQMPLTPGGAVPPVDGGQATPPVVDPALQAQAQQAQVQQAAQQKEQMQKDAQAALAIPDPVEPKRPASVTEEVANYIKDIVSWKMATATKEMAKKTAENPEGGGSISSMLASLKAKILPKTEQKHEQKKATPPAQGSAAPSATPTTPSPSLLAGAVQKLGNFFKAATTTKPPGAQVPTATTPTTPKPKF